MLAASLRRYMRGRGEGGWWGAKHRAGRPRYGRAQGNRTATPRAAAAETIAAGSHDGPTPRLPYNARDD
jgi:hypothetical protein